SGESGKSTIVKQIKIIHQAGFDDREREEYRTIIYNTVLDSAGCWRGWCAGWAGKGTSGARCRWRFEGRCVCGHRSCALYTRGGAQCGDSDGQGERAPADGGGADTCSRCPCTDARVRAHSYAVRMLMNACSFFLSIHRVAAPTYVPSEEDLLRVRAKSTAIIETRFWMGDLLTNMPDVGGQRAERKKWIHCFE
ncbi:G-protein alpha subunit-domain-containing protein, partial [Mycena epipterygia]